MANTTVSALSKRPKFPLPSSQHGSDMATIIVGQDDKQRQFYIHRNLLAQASEYFDRALNGKFTESAGTIKLSRHSPVAFEVVYQWLYSGQKLALSQLKDLHDCDSHNKDPEGGCSLDWLRLYNLADETLITEIKIHAYQMLIKPYNCTGELLMAASTGLVAELFDDEWSQSTLQEYFAWVAAYVLFDRKAEFVSNVDQKRWSDSWKDHPKYASMILDRIVTLSGDPDHAHLMHPANDQKFSIQAVFKLDGKNGGEPVDRLQIAKYQTMMS